MTLRPNLSANFGKMTFTVSEIDILVTIVVQSTYSEMMDEMGLRVSVMDTWGRCSRVFQPSKRIQFFVYF
jgi:hypothetical protein